MTANIIGELLDQVQRIPSDYKVRLNHQDTMLFYACRKQWGDSVEVETVPGVLVKGKSDAVPGRTHTKEFYMMSGIEIIPAFQYHGPAHQFLRASVRGDAKVYPSSPKNDKIKKPVRKHINLI